MINNLKKRKKVLYVATVYTHLANFHKPFMKMLQEKGYEVHAAASPDEGRKDEIDALGVICWDIDFKRNPFKLKNIKAIQQLKKLFKHNFFEFIHVHTPVASFLVRMIGKSSQQGPILYTAHGFHFYKGAPFMNWLIYYPAELIVKKWTDGIIVINKEDYELAKRMGYQEEKNLFYIPGVGVDLNSFSNCNLNNIRKELGINMSDIIITCVAEFTKNKNHIFLLKVWEKLQEKYNDVHLLLVGDGKERKKINELITKKNLKHVRLLGFREDVPEILKHSNVITLVSKREGLPKSVIEAMATGKPCIVSNVRGSSDLVKHGKNGYVVPLNDTGKFIYGIEKIIEDQILREQMGQIAKKVAENYSIDICEFNLNKIYEQFLIWRKEYGMGSERFFNNN